MKLYKTVASAVNIWTYTIRTDKILIEWEYKFLFNNFFKVIKHLRNKKIYHNSFGEKCKCLMHLEKMCNFYKISITLVMYKNIYMVRIINEVPLFIKYEARFNIKLTFHSIIILDVPKKLSYIS